MIAEGADSVCYKPFDVPMLLNEIMLLVGEHEEVAGDGPG
jgi:hypothetical protein